MFVTLPGISTDANLLQSKNANSSMLYTLEGIVTDFARKQVAIQFISPRVGTSTTFLDSAVSCVLIQTSVRGMTFATCFPREPAAFGTATGIGLSIYCRDVPFNIIVQETKELSELALLILI